MISPSMKASIAGLLSMAVTNGIGRFAYTPILPSMMDNLGLTNTQAGILGSASLLGYTVGAAVLSSPWLRGQRRGWLLIYLIINSLTTAAMGLASAMPILTALRFINGVTAGSGIVITSVIVLDFLRTTNRTNLATVAFSGSGWGICVSALLVIALVPLGTDWRGLWFWCAFASLAGTAAVAWLMPQTPPDLAVKQQEGASPPINQAAKALIFAYGLIGFGYIITATFLAAIVKSPTLLPGIGSYAWLIVGMVTIPSMPFWGWIGRKIGVAHGFAVCSIVLAISVALTVLGSGMAVIVIAALLFGGCINALGALGMMRLHDLCAGDTQRPFGLMTTSLGIGQTIGPVFAGIVAQATGSFLLPSLAAVAVLIVAAILTVLPFSEANNHQIISDI